MKVFFVFMLSIAVALAFPTGESESQPQSELQPELKKEEQNTLLSAEGDPKGDNAESAAERAKRFIFVGAWPIAYSYPVVYSYPAVTSTKVISYIG